ncbi:MAG: hypothetical protein ABR576_06540 [Thermoanaerobaculia bacterium]
MSVGAGPSALERLEASKTRRPGPSPASLIEVLSREEFRDAESLIRYHEALIFLRAYPPDPGTVRAADSELLRFAERVRVLEELGVSLEPFDDPEVSGVAGTAITTDYSFDVARWLKRRYPRHVRAHWDDFDATDRLRALWPRFLPLLEEEALEDANVPYREWLAAAGVEDELAWLLRRVEELREADREKAERYDALALEIRWELREARASRSGMRWPARKIFFHDGPLISRREVSLEAELEGPAIAVRDVPAREAARVVEMVRGATVLRYREYYGFTYADSSRVRRVDLGRGVEIFLFGLERDRRLPLRAAFAAFIVKNGVPVGYVEALAFFERVEVGFNVYYAFREGESAWIFGRVLNVLRDFYGVTSFSIDPYQIGHENPEAIDSGAFWFYRKLGFHPTSPPLRRLARKEELKIEAEPGYRSPPRVLRRLAEGAVIYDALGTRQGRWDRFHIRRIGLAVQRSLARDYGGDAERMRSACRSRVARILGIDWKSARPAEVEALTNLSLVWSQVPDLARWSRQEKAALAAIARAKAGPDERTYLRRLQRHAHLREEVRKLGSGR